MEKEESIITYEIKQKKLKRKVKKLKKKTPYFIVGFIFFGISLFFLLEDKLNKFLGNSYNLILLISTICIFIIICYIIIITKKTNRVNKEVKTLGEKMYHIMKLKKNE